MKFVTRSGLLGLALFLAAPGSAVPEELQSAIDYLLEYVRTSEVVFIRNAKEHTSAEAAEHMQKKYDHFRKEIHTPEDFIRLTATQSLLSKKLYQVRLPDGVTLPAHEWLSTALLEYRERPANPPAADRP